MPTYGGLTLWSPRGRPNSPQPPYHRMSNSIHGERELIFAAYSRIRIREADGFFV
jgi:hypothetical protein